MARTITLCVLCRIHEASVYLREQVGAKDFPVCDICWKAYLQTGQV